MFASDTRGVAVKPVARGRGFVLSVLLAALCAWGVTGVGCAPRAELRGAPQVVVPARFAPSAALQRLIDPRPAPRGLSWLGGDGAVSVAVGKDRWIWTFGDTLLGTVSDRCPAGASYCDRSVDDDRSRGMIPNSVGVMRREPDGSFSPIVKFWRVENGEPRPIFDAEAPDEFLWPLAALRVGSHLLVAASRHTRERGLASLGTVLLRVSNPDARPDLWRFTRHPMPCAAAHRRADLTWSTALVRVGRHVYVFGKRGDGPGARSLLARVAVADVEARGWCPAPEYLLRAAEGGTTWGRALEDGNLYEIEGLPGTSEASVGFDERLGWYTYQIPFLRFEVRLYTARRVVGPWHDRGVVYEIPAPWRTARPGEGDAYFAYAVKAHPELAPAGGQVLSYNVNVVSGSYEAAESAAEQVPGFYVPQMIWRGAPAR